MSQLAPTRPPLAAQAPPGQPPGSTSAPPGAAGEEPPFEAALDAELARTAPAEGQKAEQQDSRATARRGSHGRSADDALAAAANVLATATAANDSRSGTATPTPIAVSELSAGVDGTQAADAQPPQNAQTAADPTGADSDAGGEPSGGLASASIAPDAAPEHRSTTTSVASLISAQAAASEAQAAQPSAPSATATSALATSSSALPGGELDAPTAPSSSVASAQKLEPSPSQTTPQQQPSAASGVLTELDEGNQGASVTTSTISERPRTNPRPIGGLRAEIPARDGVSATSSTTAQADLTLSAPPSGDRLSPGTEAEVRAAQHLTNTAADAAAPRVLDNQTANTAQGTPTSVLQTPSESSTAQPVANPGATLQQAVESLQATVEVAARQGLTQARIQLHPAELGEIRIHLTQTSAGLLARVSADSSAAAQALISAHGELRQSLSSLGIDLAQLHVGAHDAAGTDLGQGAGGQQHAGAHEQASAQTSGEGREGHMAATDGRGEEASAGDQGAASVGAAGAVVVSESTPGKPIALIDVLA